MMDDMIAIQHIDEAPHNWNIFKCACLRNHVYMHCKRGALDFLVLYCMDLCTLFRKKIHLYAHIDSYTSFITHLAMPIYLI